MSMVKPIAILLVGSARYITTETHHRDNGTVSILKNDEFYDVIYTEKLAFNADQGKGLGLEICTDLATFYYQGEFEIIAQNRYTTPETPDLPVHYLQDLFHPGTEIMTEEELDEAKEQFHQDMFGHKPVWIGPIPESKTTVTRLPSLEENQKLQELFRNVERAGHRLAETLQMEPTKGIFESFHVAMSNLGRHLIVRQLQDIEALMNNPLISKPTGPAQGGFSQSFKDFLTERGIDPDEEVPPLRPKDAYTIIVDALLDLRVQIDELDIDETTKYSIDESLDLIEEAMPDLAPPWVGGTDVSSPEGDWPSFWPFGPQETEKIKEDGVEWLQRHAGMFDSGHLNENWPKPEDEEDTSDLPVEPSQADIDAAKAKWVDREMLSPEHFSDDPYAQWPAPNELADKPAPKYPPMADDETNDEYLARLEGLGFSREQVLGRPHPFDEDFLDGEGS